MRKIIGKMTLEYIILIINEKCGISVEMSFYDDAVERKNIGYYLGVNLDVD